MSLDGFVPTHKDAFHGYSALMASTISAALDGLGRKIRVDVRGLENLPAGPALLVANHAFGFDVAFVIARIRAETGRRVWALGEHAWWADPAPAVSVATPGASLPVSPFPDAALRDRRAHPSGRSAAKDFLAEVGWDPQYGARPLKRAIQKYLEDPLAKQVIAGEHLAGTQIAVDLGPDGQLTFKARNVDRMRSSALGASTNGIAEVAERAG